MHDINHSMYALQIEWNVDVVMCHCMCIYVGSSSRGRIQLLGIAHPVVGSPFQVHEKTALLRGREYEEGRVVALRSIL